MRNRKFYVARTDVSVNDFICRRRFICFYKSVQRFCCGISRFHFHWDHFSVFFYQKFQFVGIVRLVIIKRIAVFHQRFGDNIFVNTALAFPFIVFSRIALLVSKPYIAHSKPVSLIYNLN